jgi:hypothetical protein
MGLKPMEEARMRQIDYFWGIFGAAVLSVPFGLIWNRLAPIYFYSLPALYQHLPFWHWVGLFVLAAILRALLYPACCPYWDRKNRFKD